MQPPADLYSPYNFGDLILLNLQTTVNGGINFKNTCQAKQTL